MKKEVLFIALPALMALAGCSGISNKPVFKENAFVDAIVEDNLAHEEFFDTFVTPNYPSIRYLPVVDSETNYKIGYQLHYDGSTDKISIRYVAAIKAEYSSMVWSRGVTSGDGGLTIGFGNQKYGSSDLLESTEVYTSLSNGVDNDVITAGEDSFADYTGFIVYSMTNIPYTSCVDYYVGASLTLHPAEGDDIVTPVYAIKIERNPENLNQSLYSFSFPNSNIGHFMSGKFGGIKKNIAAEHPARNNNQATFVTNFETGDEFLIVKKTSDEFRVWDSRRIANVHDHFEAGDGKRIKLDDEDAGGYIRIFLNNTDNGYLYASTSAFVPGGEVDLYIKGTHNSWEAEVEYRFVADGTEDSVGVIYGVSLAKDVQFKLSRADWKDGSWGSCYSSGTSRLRGEAAGKFSGDIYADNNITCNETGTYNIVLGNDNFIYFGFQAPVL